MDDDALRMPWMPYSPADGVMRLDGGYSRMESKRTHQWFDDGCDLDFYPYKRQASEHWNVMPGFRVDNAGRPTSFQREPDQFVHRLFRPETAGLDNRFHERNISSGGTGYRPIGYHSQLQNMVDAHFFDPSIQPRSPKPVAPVSPEALIQQISSMAAQIDTLTANMAAMQLASVHPQDKGAQISAEFLNPDEHLCAVKQTGTVEEYRQEFARRSSIVKHWPEHCLLGVFLNGLKDELKADVRMQKPLSVDMAMTLAIEYEAKQQLTSSSSLSSDRAATSTTLNAPARNPAHQQIRQDKGNCFRCGYKFTTGHHCKNKDDQKKQEKGLIQKEKKDAD